MSVLISLFILGLVVFLHEFGHLVAARLTHTPVKRFSVGMGKPIMKIWFIELQKVLKRPNTRWYRLQIELNHKNHIWTIEQKEHAPLDLILATMNWFTSGTEWCVSWLPLGGYVSLDKIKSPLKQTVVAVAGPLANFCTAFLALVTVFMIQNDLSLMNACRESILSILDTLAHIKDHLMLVSQSKEELQVMGPVGILTAGSEIDVFEWVNMLTFLSALSIGLGFMNLLPIIPLDGGRIFYTWLKVPLPRLGLLLERVTGVVTTLGLFCFMIWITAKELIQLF